MRLADRAPQGDELTEYDRHNLKIYLRLLDAKAVDAPWEEVARRLLDIDPHSDRERAWSCYSTHIARAEWLRDGGYADLLHQQG